MGGGGYAMYIFDDSSSESDSEDERRYLDEVQVPLGSPTESEVDEFCPNEEDTSLNKVCERIFNLAWNELTAGLRNALITKKDFIYQAPNSSILDYLICRLLTHGFGSGNFRVHRVSNLTLKITELHKMGGGTITCNDWVGQRVRVSNYSVYYNDLEGIVLQPDCYTSHNQVRVELEFPGGYTALRYLEPEYLVVVNLARRMYEEDCERIWLERLKQIETLRAIESFKTVSFSCPEPAREYLEEKLRKYQLRFDAVVDDEIVVYLQ